MDEKKSLVEVKNDRKGIRKIINNVVELLKSKLNKDYILSEDSPEFLKRNKDLILKTIKKDYIYLDKVPDDILFIPTKADGTPLWDTSSVTDMSNMFSYCKNLETIPLLDTSSVTNMKNMFDGCDNLQTIPLLDTSSVSNMTNMFGGCKNLSNDSLNNILKMCINSKETDKRLKGIGLTQEQAEKCQTLSNWSDFVAAGWTTGY